MKINYITPAQYAVEHPEITWQPYSKGFQLYASSNLRYNVTIERGEHPQHFAWYHALTEQYSDVGIHESQLDADAFAEDFVTHFCNHLSLCDLKVLIPRMQRFYDEWEASRQLAIKRLNNDTDSSGNSPPR